MIVYCIPLHTKFESGPIEGGGESVGVDILMDLTGNISTAIGTQGIRLIGSVDDMRNLRNALDQSLLQAAQLRELLARGILGRIAKEYYDERDSHECQIGPGHHNDSF